MRNIFFKGENILVRWSVVDKYNDPILFADLSEVIVKVTDVAGNQQEFKKTTGGVVAGVETNQYQFEITEAMSSAFAAGKLRARFTYRLPSAEHISLELTDIIEEGVNNEFITLQE